MFLVITMMAVHTLLMFLVITTMTVYTLLWYVYGAWYMRVN